MVNLYFLSFFQAFSESSRPVDATNDNNNQHNGKVRLVTIFN